MNRAPLSVCRPRQDRGFALVVTLIMVTLAAVIVVALLVNASMERTTSTSYAHRFSAELAVQNGLEAAKQALMGPPTAVASITNDDSFLVLKAEGTQTNASGMKDAYYFLAKARPRPADIVDCYPLFSGGTSSELTIDLAQVPVVQIPTAPTGPLATPAEDASGKRYPQLLSFQQPAYTAWQEIRDPADTAIGSAHNLPYQRFTFWVEDLGGYLDASVVGNEAGPGSSHQRTNGSNANEIALFTIFDPTSATDAGSTLAKNLIDNRGLLFTSPTLKQLAAPPPNQVDATQPNLVARMGIDDTGETNMIPLGFGFPGEGTAKTNLNTVITDETKTDDQKVTALAATINSNLPAFATTRKGSLAITEDYTKTLAANIIGYATGNPVVGSDYRGIGLHPFVVEFYEKFTWEHQGSETTNFYLNGTTWWANVRAIGYVELWNMSNREINSGTFQFQDINRYYAYVGGTSDQNEFEDSFGTGMISFSPSNSLQPNEFKVFKIYEHLYRFDTGLTIRPTGSAATVRLGSSAGATSDPTDCGYLCLWNGARIERAGSGSLDGARDDGSDSYPGLNYSGLERTSVLLATPGSSPDPKWRGTLPGLRYAFVPTSIESIYNLGDPRSAYFITENQSNVAYDKQSAWGGRMYQHGLVASGWKAAETTVANWPDGGHNTAQGVLPGTTTADPMTLQGRPATEPAKAPSFIAATGRYASITELSRVYDPIQWKPAGFPPTSPADFQQKWRDAWKSNMTPDANYGCASSLRIGSPEFKDFDRNDARASRLLDLFTVTDRTFTRGLVNLNTASRDALRSLAAGIEMKRDAAIVPPSVFGPVNDPTSPTAADKFADTVMSNRPFLTRSQLSELQTNPADQTSKFFGNSTQWTSGGPIEWNDTAREEYFSRLFDLTTVRSRNFRVFVTGQSLDKSGNALSTVNRVLNRISDRSETRQGVSPVNRSKLLMNKTFSFVIAVAASMLQFSARAAGDVPIGFINAVGLPTKTDFQIDGRSIKPAGFAAGAYAGSFGLAAGSHRFSFANPSAQAAVQNANIMQGASPLYVLYNAPARQRDGTIKNILKVAEITPQPLANAVQFFVFSTMEGRSAALQLNGSPSSVAPLRLTPVPGATLTAESEGIKPLRSTPREKGNYVLVLYDGIDSRLRWSLVEMTR